MFVQHMECTHPLDNVDNAIGCICLRWITDDEISHNLSSVPEKVRNGSVKVEEWIKIEPLPGINELISVV